MTQRPVETAYEALVRAAASCGLHVSACTSAATDDAARTSCRDEFATCREQAGNDAVQQMAAAIKACTKTHRDCVQGAGSAQEAMCESALQDCLGVEHAARKGEDEDAGGKSEHAAAVADCVDTLHACVKGGQDAKVCAQNVRECVLASVPTPDDVVPGAGKANAQADHGDKADAGMHANNSGGSDHAAHDAGRPSDVPRQPHAAGAAGHGNGNGNDNADAGSPSAAAQGSSSAAMACLDSFSACVDGGSNPRDCAKNLQLCPRGK